MRGKCYHFKTTAGRAIFYCTPSLFLMLVRLLVKKKCFGIQVAMSDQFSNEGKIWGKIIITYSSACINLSRKIFQKKIATYVFLEARILTISWPSRVIFAFLSYYFFCKIYFDEHWIRFVTITISWGRRAIILNKETIWIRCLLCSTPLNLNSLKKGGGENKENTTPAFDN